MKILKHGLAPLYSLNESSSFKYTNIKLSTRYINRRQDVFTINDFPESTVEFETVKVKNTESLWINKSAILDLDESYHVLCDEEAFSERFSYVIPNTECFKVLELEPSERKTLLAERYGGAGLAANAGGVRCGNDGIFQIKGIGSNILQSEDSDILHSYGGLSLEDAVKEAIIAEVLSKSLPVGVATIYGIIFLSDRSAYSLSYKNKYGNDGKEPQRCAGALLVREACLRPAHFLRAPNLTRDKARKKGLMPDENRIKRTNKNLKQKFISDKEYIQFLGKFLSNFSHQLAASRFLNISHKHMSESNVTMGGKWLDVPVVDFGNSGLKTGGAASSRADELQKPLKLCEQLIYNYCKYNKKNLNIQPLINYYYSQLDAYTAFELSRALRLHDGKVEYKDHQKLQVITSHFIELVSKDDSEAMLSDLANNKLKNYFYALLLGSNQIEKSTKILSSLGVQRKKIEKVIESFETVIKFGYIRNKNYFRSKEHYAIFCTLNFFKQIELKTMFNMQISKLGISISNKCKKNLIEEVKKTVNVCMQHKNWVFERNNFQTTTLINNDNVTVLYDIVNNGYIINTTGFVKNKAETKKYTSFSELVRDMDSYPSEMFDFYSYSMKNYLVNLIDVISHYESAVPGQ